GRAPELDRLLLDALRQGKCRSYPVHSRSGECRRPSAKQKDPARHRRIEVCAFSLVPGRFRSLLLPIRSDWNRGDRKPAVRRVWRAICKTSAVYPPLWHSATTSRPLRGHRSLRQADQERLERWLRGQLRCRRENSHSSAKPILRRLRTATFAGLRLLILSAPPPVRRYRPRHRLLPVQSRPPPVVSVWSRVRRRRV